MMPEHHLIFGPFRLDTTQSRLWHGEQAILLRRRSFEMLRYFAEHPGRLITKAELRQHVWSGIHVNDTVLRVCVWEIRAALGDVAEAPQYLQTVRGQGYQFYVQVDGAVSPPVVAGPIIVGRQREVDTLEEWFQRAARGDRQVVFLSGEAGVGKTTVLDLWLDRLAAGSPVWIGRGQCTEHYGAVEPYLPLLDALRQLGHGPHGQELLAVLRRYAPMWLTQLPGLLSDAELDRVQRQVEGATQARMIRELVEALDVLTADTPLVLILEDLHWSDNATIDFLTFLAQRREPARLLVLGTYRPVETVLRSHPLRGMAQELVGRGRCVELRLELLPAEDIAAYVAGRLGGAVTAALAAFVHERTEGNALFMVHIVEHLLQQGLIIGHEGQWTLLDGAEAKLESIPEEVRQMLLRRIEELPPATRQVLEAASVAGQEFAVAAVAAGAQRPVEEVEAVCEGLAAQQHFLDEIGPTVWPDGTSGGSYRFLHTLYPQVLYGHLGSARRRQLHQRLGVRLEAGYGAQAGEIASRLAFHFERGGELYRAVRYLQQVADNATRRNTHHEAVAALTKGIELLATVPESPLRTQRELTLLLILGQRLIAVKGFGVPEVGDVYTRAHTLVHQAGNLRQRCQVLQGLYRFYVLQAQLRQADELSQLCFRLTSPKHDIVLVLESYMDLGLIAFYRGDPVAARAHLEHSLRLYDTTQLSTLLFPHEQDSEWRYGFYGTRALWLLGYADQAQQWNQEALTEAQQVGRTPSLARAQHFAAILSQHRRDMAATQAYAEAVLALATAQGFAHRVAQGRILLGWALAMQGAASTGVAYLQQGLEAVQRIGQKLNYPYHLALLAEGYGQAGQPEAGLSVLEEALARVATTEERWWEAEVFRLKGALLLQLPSPDVHRAETCFQQALAVARSQQAKALELRAALSLSRLWQQQGKGAEAHEFLTSIYGWFTEGFDTADLQEAQVLLEKLAQ